MDSMSVNVSVLLLVALKSEARPIIRYLRLKQIKEISNRFYTNEEVGLLVTGIGGNIVEEDLFNIIKEINPMALLNVGICGSIDKSCKIGSIFYVNKIRCDITKKVFYPDVIIKTGLSNSSLVTFSTPQMEYSKHNNATNNYLVDMEGSILFRIIEKAYGPDKFQVLKIVSDHLSADEFSSVNVGNIIESSLSVINGFISKYILFINSQPYIPKEVFDFIDVICKNLSLTKTQSRKINRLITSRYLQSEDMLNKFRCLTKYKCNEKKQRSTLFVKVCNELLQ